MKSWIYRLNKAELVTELDRLRLNSTGGIDLLRRRLRTVVETTPDYQYPGDLDRPEPMAKEGSSKTTLGEPAKVNLEPAPLDTAKVMDQIRKWGCHFDGKDPLAFLERIEELRDGYGFTGQQLLQGLPELLRGDTLLWYRNTKASWKSWDNFEEDFRREFLPRRYRTRLTQQIQGRLQKTDESFRQYSTALLTDMRRAGGFSTDDQLDRLYENMSPELKLYIRLDDVTSVSELQARAAEVEEIQRQTRDRKADKKATASIPSVAAAYSREECCWRCKQRGHTRLDCKRPAKKFCSRCGKDGVLTRDCHPPSGNAGGAGGEAAAARSSE